MNFIVDMQLPNALVRAIRAGEHNAYHISELADRVTPDRRIWDLAIEHHGTIITKDEDFIGILARERLKVPILWLRCGNIYNSDLVEIVLRELDQVVAAIGRGKLLIELWR